MNKLKTTTVFTTTLLMGLVLSRFAISKLTGWEISVKAFIEMAKPLGIDPTFFRISTGILISTVFIGYLITAFFTLFRNKIELPFKLNYYNLAFFTNTLGLLTMVGALFSEFLLRVEPKWLLVYIATAVVIFSAINIIIIKNNSTLYNKLTTFKK